MWTAPALLALLVVPAAVGLLTVAAFRWKRRTTARLGDPAVVARLVDPRTGRYQRGKALLRFLAGIFLALSLAGPRWGSLFQEIHRRGIDVVIAVDVSASMLAEDVKPNRLTQAKRELTLLIDGLEGDRVGLVAFAGAAFLQCPLTLDYGAARTLLDLIGPDLIPRPGTDLAAALRQALDAFPRGLHQYKAIVLLTDGEDHSGALDAAVSRAAEEGVRIFPVGFGSPQGEIIPLRDESGNLSGYKKDKNGQTVLSKMDEKALRDMAEKTGGTYFPASRGEIEVPRLLTAFRQMEKRSLESRVYGQLENRYRWPLWLAIGLLLLEFLVPESGGWGRRLWKGLRSSVPLAAALVFLTPSARAMGRAPTAGELSRAVEKNPEDPRAQFQWGQGLYREGSYAAAAEAFEKVSSRTSAPELRSAALYNAGNAYFRQGKTDEAIKKYKEALRLFPSDPDAKHNLEFARKLKKAGGKPRPQPGSPEDDKKPRDGSGSSGEPPINESKGAGTMTQEDAERLLQAVEDQEKRAQRRARRGQPSEPPQGPDW